MQSENVTQKRPKYIQFRSRCFKKKLCRNCPSMQPISRCVNQFFTYQVAIIVTEEELVLVKCNFFELAVDPANDLWMQRRQLPPGCKGCRQNQVLEHSRHQHTNSLMARFSGQCLQFLRACQDAATNLIPGDLRIGPAIEHERSSQIVFWTPV